MKNHSEHSTRQMILNMLKTKPEQSAGVLARRLGITEMAVRRHLNMLERDELIRTSLLRQAMGRPTRVYSLTAKADDLFPKNYHRLTLDLLGEMESEGRDQVDTLFEKRKERLFRKYRPRMEGKNLRERVCELAEIQNAGGYMVEWEEDAKGHYVFKEFNCPISQVANAYHVACDCELNLFRSLLKTDVERTECLAQNGKKCTYLIKTEP